MDRRQFMQSLNASGMGAIMPASMFVNGNPSDTTQVPPVPTVDDRPLVIANATTWKVPKVGIVSIGGVGRFCLPQPFHPDVKFPNFIRTVAVDTYCTDFHFINADHKVQLDKDKLFFHRHDEKALAQTVLTEMTDAVADLDMVILVAGLGGIVGTTVTPRIAAQMKRMGVLTLAMVVMPYAEEGGSRQRVAETALQTLRGKVDALLPVYNDQFDEYL